MRSGSGGESFWVSAVGVISHCPSCLRGRKGGERKRRRWVYTGSGSIAPKQKGSGEGLNGRQIRSHLRAWESRCWGLKVAHLVYLPARKWSNTMEPPEFSFHEV